MSDPDPIRSLNEFDFESWTLEYLIPKIPQNTVRTGFQNNIRAKFIDLALYNVCFNNMKGCLQDPYDNFIIK